MKETEYYEQECPFCHRKHRQLQHCNIMCDCNGKYYYADKMWLDRNTGREIFDDERN